MSGIFASLNAASSALQTHGKGVELAGKNIANINDPNYTRQRITTGSIGAGVAGGSGIGTTVYAGVEQLRDVYIDRQILTELSHSASLQTEDARLRQILGALGESIDRVNDPAFINDSSADSGSLRGRLDSFFNAFESLAANPSDPSTRTVLLQSAEALVDTFNQVDQRLAQMDDSLVREMDSEARAMNAKLAELAELNREIARLGSRGAANDLIDTRQSALETLSEYISFESETVDGSGGQIAIHLRDINGDRVALLEPGAVPSGLVYEASTNQFRSSSTGGAVDLQDGRLASLARVRGEHLGQTRSEVDLLANEVATAVNEIYYQAYAPAGTGPAVPEAAFFQEPTPPPGSSGSPSTVTAASIQLYEGSTDPLVLASIPLTAESLRGTATELAGANEIADAIARLGREAIASLGGLDPSRHAAGIAVDLGHAIEDIADRLEVQTQVEALLQDQRARTSGVSLDEEVADLVQYQRAFQASSRVFNTLSEMLETIVTGLR